MNKNMFRYILFILIILILVRINSNQNFYHYYFIFKLKLLYYFYCILNNVERLEFKNNLKYLENNSLQQFIDDNQNTKIIEYYTPFFKKLLILNFYDENYINPLIYGKKDSLSDLLTELIVPKNICGKWLGKSVFLTDYKNRGKNNYIKKKYMFALQQQYLVKYEKIMNNYFQTIQKYNGSLFEFIQNICIDLTFKIHFDSLPTNKEKYYMKLFIKSFSIFFLENKINIYEKYIYESKEFINLLKKRINRLKNNENCIIGLWIKYNKINKKNSLTEFLHNIVGMTVNWINLLYSFTKEYKVNIPIEEIDKNKYLHECMRYICPVKIINSKIINKKHFNIKSWKKFNVIHNLNKVCKDSNYFRFNNEFNINNFNDSDFISNNNNIYNYSLKNAIILKNQNLCEKKGYVPFGEGYRRCPGEHLSYKILDQYKNFLSSKNYSIYNLNNIEKINFSFDYINYNLYINI